MTEIIFKRIIETGYLGQIFDIIDVPTPIWTIIYWRKRHFVQISI